MSSLKKLSRRKFLTAGGVAAAGAAMTQFRRARPEDGPLAKHGGHAGHNMSMRSAKEAAARARQWLRNAERQRLVCPHRRPGRNLRTRSCPARTIRRSTNSNGTTVPWKIVDGVKVFHLTHRSSCTNSRRALRQSCGATTVKMSGPLIEAVEGDRIRIYVTNKLACRPACTGTD